MLPSRAGLIEVLKIFDEKELEEMVKGLLRISIRNTVGIFIVCWLLFAVTDYSGAAVVPNGQLGKCGPYYLWYQTGPDMYSLPGAYLDLCEITFDISDVVDDFDFVYFTDTAVSQRASLDRDQDGVSDWNFFKVDHNLLRWKPAYGCMRITARGCEGTQFNPQCGYAMISIQPKPDFHLGSAKIPVIMRAKCPPYGNDCSETAFISHQYSNCFPPPTPKFMVQITASALKTRYYNEAIVYTMFIRNTQQKKDNILVTNTISEGTKEGSMTLLKVDLSGCPVGATCSIIEITNRQIKISITNFLEEETGTITYTRKANDQEILEGKVSYFTDTVTIASGTPPQVLSSDQVTVGVQGTAKVPRKERPKPADYPPPF